MNKLTTREQVLVIIALLLGFAYLFINFLWQPLATDYTKTKAELAAKRAELEWLRQGAESQGETEERGARLVKTYRELGKKVPDGFQTSELLYLLQEKAVTVGVTLMNMQLIGEPQLNNRVVVIPVLVETTGSFNGTIEFLRQLESFPRLIKMPGLTWQYTGDKLTGRIELTIYSVAGSESASSGQPANPSIK
ncbi:MAG: type II secretion system protein GspM [Thermincolia bacterium]